MTFDLKQIERNYNLYSDAELQRIVLCESRCLYPEVIEVLRREVEKRNFPKSLIKTLEIQKDIQVNPLSDMDINLLADKINSFACPHCNQYRGITANIVTTCYSQVKKVRIKDYFILGCSYCVIDKAKKYLVRSALLGWWSIPGIFVTPFIIIKNTVIIFSKKNTIYLQFLKENAAYIKALEEDKSELNKFIINCKEIDPRILNFGVNF
jgi:hypothetical protein